MKIHLIKSPEYETENLKEVYQLLNSYKGPLEFVMNDYEFEEKDFYFLQYKLHPHHNFKFESELKKIAYIKERGYPLSFEELFILCGHFRKQFRIKKNDFVVLLTYRFNSLNWFSHCNNEKNIFIHAAEWDKFYIKVHHKYPVAYQVIENVLQNLMEIDSEDGNNEFIHYKVRGCINDFCKDKREVILKLRTADICMSCFKRIITQEIPSDLIDQIFQILEGLRTQFLFKKGINRIVGPFSIFIDEDNKLLIPQLGNKELQLEPILCTLYILFLMNPDGIKLNDLVNFKNQLKRIYSFMNPNTTPEQIEKSIKYLTDPINGTFSQKKSKINKRIKEQLGDTYCRDFLISGERGQPFKINLSLHNSDIRL